MDNSSKTILIILFIIVILFLLHILQSILLPLFLAFFVAAIFQPVVIFLKKIKIPTFISITIIVLFIFAVIFGIFLVVQSTMSDIIADSQYLSTQITKRINDIFAWANSTFGSKLSFNRLYKQIIKQMDTAWISQRASDVFSMLSSFTGSAVMFFLYLAVLLSGMSNYKKFFEYVEDFNPERKILQSYEQIQKIITSYMVIKSLLNIIMALITYIVCISFGIKFALFWSFITFVVSFIPTVGSIVSTAFPALMAAIQFDNFNTVIYFVLILIVAHFIMGNIVEPIIMGTNMSINTLTVIFGLVFWGFIWGIPGMMLSVPLLVVFKIALEQFTSLKIFSRLMGVPDKKATNPN